MRKLKVLLFLVFFVGATVYAEDDPQIDVVALKDLKVDNYLGKWYEVARLPFTLEEQCAKDISIDYIMTKNKLSVKSKCATDTDLLVTHYGVASFVSKETKAELQLNFSSKWIRWTKYGSVDSWILNTNYTNFAVVGSPDHQYLWIYSRTPKMDVEELQQLVGFVQNSGYDVSNLIYNKSSIKEGNM